MSTIVIAPLYWHSDLNATFALAKKLERAGHRVHYVCIPDLEERIRAQGFDFVSIFSSVFPRGTLARQAANEAVGKYLGAAGINDRVKSMCDLCRNGELTNATRHLHPDLFLVSNHLPWAGIEAWKTRLPVIMFSSIIVFASDSMVPPGGSDIIPSPDLRSRLHVWWEWKKTRLLGKLVARVSGMWKSAAYLKELAVATGYPVSKIDFSVTPWPRLLLPELIFFPEWFGFQRAKPMEGAFYVEPSVNADRKDKDFPFEKLDSRPLIYCSVGTLITFKHLAMVRQFFHVLLEALGQRPNLQAVVAIGNFLKPEEFSCPENVILTDDAPQVALLKRARLMVGHAGAGCIREGAFYGVPMLLLPMAFDAPGNAARVAYHGMALRADFRKVSAQELIGALDKLLNDPSYSESAKRMSQRLREVEDEAPSLAIIQRALAGDSFLTPGR
ncbi:MAG TPA: glycosyltransferase [Candidatus Angelobacter sp.]